MATWPKTYRFLAEADNAAADEALVAAVRQVEGAYLRYAVEVLLQRAQPAGYLAMVENYHRLLADLKDRKVLAAAPDLAPAMRAAIRDAQVQTRVNCLEMASQIGSESLAYLFDMGLADMHTKVRESAAVMLREMARQLLTEHALLKLPTGTRWPDRSRRSRRRHGRRHESDPSTRLMQLAPRSICSRPCFPGRAVRVAFAGRGGGGLRVVRAIPGRTVLGVPASRVAPGEAGGGPDDPVSRAPGGVLHGAGGRSPEPAADGLAADGRTAGPELVPRGAARCRDLAGLAAGPQGLGFHQGDRVPADGEPGDLAAAGASRRRCRRWSAQAICRTNPNRRCCGRCGASGSADCRRQVLLEAARSRDWGMDLLRYGPEHIGRSAGDPHGGV